MRAQHHWIGPIQDGGELRLTKDLDEIDLGCATATPLELKLLETAKRHAAGEEGAQQDAREIIADYLKESGQLTEPDILRLLTD